ncbi:MAG: alanine racemase [Candidatus Melainabacteria bacterium]|jgi:alanine racemase|nr:alanine racemase [Candidatus Melainabacteria bacterium]
MVQLRPTQKQSYRRDAWLEINLDNLEFNLKNLYAEFNKPLIPVLKADAYGHGAVMIAKVLDAYDFVHGYGVASVDEALSLREASKKPIIVLSVSPEWAMEQALENDIELTIVDLESAKKLNQIAKEMGKSANVHIKFDTGMNRIGFRYEDRQDVFEIEKLECLKIQSLFTHFVDAIDTDYAIYQYQQFRTFITGLKYPVHPSSSQAARSVSDMEADYIRCGIELYGLENLELRPLLSLKARISFIKTINKGETVSYKRTWVASENTRIATLPLGYADGVPRSLSSKIVGQVKSHEIKQVGLITMDQMMFDIASADIQVGDVVDLLTEDLPVAAWAEAAGTISYEIVSALNLRLPKTYTRN